MRQEWQSFGEEGSEQLQGLDSPGPETPRVRKGKAPSSPSTKTCVNSGQAAVGMGAGCLRRCSQPFPFDTSNVAQASGCTGVKARGSLQPEVAFLRASVACTSTIHSPQCLCTLMSQVIILECVALESKWELLHDSSFMPK